VNKLNYHDFYLYLWEDENLSVIISDRFIDEEQDFIRNFTLELWRQYDLSNDMSARAIKKMVEILFSNLSMFKPDIEIIRPLTDKNGIF
tara:strand:+ start:35037 stop:35303 length:267 start_codon:yes stop_codon:yes gene_type:complete